MQKCRTWHAAQFNKHDDARPLQPWLDDSFYSSVAQSGPGGPTDSRCFWELGGARNVDCLAGTLEERKTWTDSGSPRTRLGNTVREDCGKLWKLLLNFCTFVYIQNFWKDVQSYWILRLILTSGWFLKQCFQTAFSLDGVIKVSCQA